MLEKHDDDDIEDIQTNVIGIIYADFKAGEAEIFLHPAFMSDSSLMTVDLMADLMGCATDLYNQSLRRMRKDSIARKKERENVSE
tara:strand:+ start:270 stop:524 length:255 start_codon:yes stop_codon:yes gene_type:complete